MRKNKLTAFFHIRRYRQQRYSTILRDITVGYCIQSFQITFIFYFPLYDADARPQHFFNRNEIKRGNSLAMQRLNKYYDDKKTACY